MVIILKQNVEQQSIDNLITWLHSQNLKTNYSRGAETTLIGLIGNTSIVDIDHLLSIDIIHDVKRIEEPYRSANRKFHHVDTVVDVSGVKIGAGNFTLMAGPCSVESREQITSIARDVKKSGATILRGGAFKPRSSPYSFQGLGSSGIDLLLEAKKETGLPIISELMDLSDYHLFEDVDIIQIGARNMQNFSLLREMSKIDKPILLKRGLANTIEEFLMSAEYLMAGGNKNIILCERGIRTFETSTRNTLDLSVIPVLKEKTHLPIIIDPSHATGYSRFVKPLSLAATAAGADGLIVEVHNDPAQALCDGNQSLTPKAFDEMVHLINGMLPIVKEANLYGSHGL